MTGGVEKAETGVENSSSFCLSPDQLEDVG